MAVIVVVPRRLGFYTLCCSLSEWRVPLATLKPLCYVANEGTQTLPLNFHAYAAA